MQKQNFTLRQLQQACDEVGITLTELDEGYMLESGDDALYFSLDQAGINDAMDILQQDAETLNDHF